MNTDSQPLEVKNRLIGKFTLNLDDIDLSDFNTPLDGLRVITRLIQGKISGLGIYKCNCAKLFLFPVREVKPGLIRIKNDILLCSKCSGGTIQYKITPSDFAEKEKEIETMVDDLIGQAKIKNKLTFYFFLWGILPKEHNIDNIFETVVSFTDILRRIETEKTLKDHGYNPPPLIEPFGDKTDIRLMLIIYCHLLELVDFLDILYAVIAISTKEFSSDVKTDDGRPAFRGPVIGVTKEDLYDKLQEVIKIAKRNKIDKLRKLLDKLFKHYIRNAVYHSQYEITEKEIVFKYKEKGDTEFREKRKTIEEFTDLFGQCVKLYSYFLGRINEERYKMTTEGSVIGESWVLTPIVKDGGLSIQITNKQ